MHKVTSISQNIVSSTTPKTFPLTDLMNRTANTIDDLGVDLYHLTCCKAKIDDIFDKLAALSLHSETVSCELASDIVRLNQTISNSGVRSFYISVYQRLIELSATLPGPELN